MAKVPAKLQTKIEDLKCKCEELEGFGAGEDREAQEKEVFDGLKSIMSDASAAKLNIVQIIDIVLSLLTVFIKDQALLDKIKKVADIIRMFLPEAA